MFRKPSIAKPAVSFALACISMCAVTAQAAHTLFRNGKTSYSIVVSPKAPETELNAARELQTYLGKIGGVNIGITNRVSQAGKYIYIGYDANLNYHGTAGEQLANDGYAYQSKNSGIYIYGKTARATMYGVFSFLEDEFGVRWYAKGVTKVPKLSKYTFSGLKRSSSPEVAIRRIGYKEVQDWQWCAHNKVNGGGVPDDWGGSENYWGCHTSEQFMPVAKYYDAHPEYYSLRDGKRVSHDWQPCLSNPEVLKIFTDEVLARIAASPNNIIYDVSQNDNWGYCTCDKCNAIVEKYQSQSGIWIWFVNQVAREVKKRYPDKFIGTFAYRYTRKPPVGIVPDDNVVIRLCSIECCFMHPIDGCPEDCNRNFITDIKEWSQKAKHLYIWDYVVTYSQYLGPFPNFNVLGPNVHTFAKYNAMGIYEEAQYQSLYGEFSELRSYVLSRLMWNPQLDAASLASEFIKAFYGGAADYVQQYYDLVMGLVKDGIHCDIYPNANNPLFSDAFVEKSLALLTEAKKHCNGNDELQRIERLWLSPAYLSLMRGKGTYGSEMCNEFVRVVKRDGIRVAEVMSLDQMLEKLKQNAN